MEKVSLKNIAWIMLGSVLGVLFFNFIISPMFGLHPLSQSVPNFVICVMFGAMGAAWARSLVSRAWPKPRGCGVSADD